MAELFKKHNQQKLQHKQLKTRFESIGSDKTVIDKKNKMFENTIENLKKENQQLKIDINKIHQLQVKKSFSTQNNSSFSADLNNSISKDSLNNSLEISKEIK